MASELTQQALYDLVWSKPMRDIAKEHGLSDRGMAKLCERHGIPVPPRGYWNKKAAGHKVKKTPLVTLKDSDPETAILIRQSTPPVSTSEAPALPAEVQQAIDRERQPEQRIKVPASLHKPHEIVAKWVQIAESEAKYPSYGVRHPIKPLDRRKWRITSALFKALEERGFEVSEYGRYNQKEVWISLGRERLSYEVKEYIRRFRRPLTEKEQAGRTSPQKWLQDYEHTGKLAITLAIGEYHSGKITLTETDRSFDDTLNDVVIKIIELTWAAKSERLKQEAYEQRQREERERREEVAANKARENKRAFNLEYKAMCWQRANVVREYIAAVETARTHGEIQTDATTFEAWREWAEDQADRLDFIKQGNPLIALTGEPEDLVPEEKEKPSYGGSSSSTGSGHPWRKWYHR